jgi:uncharacterized repeat protein (TIGR03806 family)
MRRCLRRGSEHLVALLCIGPMVACGESSGAGAAGESVADAGVEVTDARGPDLSGPLPYDTLSAYGFFTGALLDLNPATGVLPYEVAAPLWSDGTDKRRFLYLPPGRRAERDAEGHLTFPAGTVAIKHFALAGRAIETRLLILTPEKWTGHTYVWNDEQTEAERKVAGQRRVFVNAAGEDQPYLIPNTNQCGNCHEQDDVLDLLGVTEAQLDRLVTPPEAGMAVNQRHWLALQGVLPDPGATPPAGRPLVDPYGDAPLDDRARSWLHANCAHCHRAGGNGGPSGLKLGIDEDDPTRLGVCKGPVAAGSGSGELTVDVDPGHPERSIMVLRMKSSDPEVKMPEIPNLLPDPRGVALIEAWIAAMPERDCRQ